MAKDNKGLGSVRQWTAADCKRGYLAKSGKTNFVDAFRRNDGPSGILKQGREEWEIVIPQYNGRNETSEASGGYLLVTLRHETNDNKVRCWIKNYPTTCIFLLVYIAVIVTLTCIEVFTSGI